MYTHPLHTGHSTPEGNQGKGSALIRVVIADDHPQVRSALRHVLELEPDFEVVAEAEDGARALEEVVRTRPNLVVLDYRMPQLNGVQAARQIGHVAPETAMVMLTSEDDPEVRAQAADAGVAHYMLKSGRAEELLRTIRAAAAESRERSITVIVGSDHAAEDNLSPPRIA
jgi:DNA-binding NarL/FixJ family response regulator